MKTLCLFYYPKIFSLDIDKYLVWARYNQFTNKIKIKWNEKFNSSATLATFQVLHTWITQTQSVYMTARSFVRQSGMIQTLVSPRDSCILGSTHPQKCGRETLVSISFLVRKKLNFPNISYPKPQANPHSVHRTYSSQGIFMELGEFYITRVLTWHLHWLVLINCLLFVHSQTDRERDFTS